MRSLVLGVLGLLLAACQPKASDACTVIRALSVEEGFRAGYTNSPDVTIKKGGCIEFVNEDPSGTIHLAQSKPTTPEELKFNTPNLLPNPEYKAKVVFNIAGEIEYICGLNTGTVVHARTMYGKITVLP
ncbi:hypothetical protein [Meiothermus sp.]|jgi:plastocyanin|uniref:cupredoxin domain-containing protein n=1 Tax=Meiothermus sp. TaxID=1955249 RepID=UPI0021DBEC1A|nr:hypothetical protein [Meiothermus sp.]GIW23937.1 MAG: hypothetical protein KatS3mg069_0204 [Meiothermus sp.]